MVHASWFMFHDISPTPLCSLALNRTNSIQRGAGLLRRFAEVSRYRRTESDIEKQCEKELSGDQPQHPHIPRP